MKIVFLTPGTGSYYCGACMRDNDLARELHRAGHDVTIAPMYLPLMLDDTAPELQKAPIFFGGINVYLQQKLAVFRRTPAVIDRLLNSHGLLRWAARHSHMTSAREHGEMTLEMLHVENSPFRKEWEKLIDWLTTEKPDLVCLSNALLAGLARELKRRLHVPVVAFFQGEDSFLDGLPEPYRSKCWRAMAERLADADMLLSPSRYYAEFMRERMGLAPGAIEVVHNGIRLDGYQAVSESSETVAETEEPGRGRPGSNQSASRGRGMEPGRPRPGALAIGYLAKLSRDKGLEVFVEAFIFLARELGDRTTRLKIAGTVTAGEEPLIGQLKRRIASAGLTSRVDWAPNLTREQKIAFLRGLTLFSVPAIYAEAFGLYVIEAMACGIPVVQPDASAFPEIIALTGGGVCVRPRHAESFARAWQSLLANPEQRAALGRAARLGVEKHFSARTMCEQFIQATERLTRATA